jgi:hypothetical protein
MILDKYFPKEQIEIMQNFLCISVSLFSTYCLYTINYVYYDDVYMASKYLSMSLDSVFYYCIFDLFFARTIDVVCHHSLVILMCLFMYENVEYSFNIDAISTVLLTEISTTFLVLNYYIGGICKQIPFLCNYKEYFVKFNSLCFLCTFIYTRVYSLLFHFILHPAFYYYLTATMENTLYIQYIYLLIYLFYGLNLYWFFKIIRLSIKPYKKYLLKN